MSVTSPLRLQATPKAPPFSLEAEQSVLGGVMIDGRAFDGLAEIITEQDFYRVDHQIIWHAITELAAQRKPIDVLTVRDQLTLVGMLEEVGGFSYVGSLANDTGSVVNILSYAKIMRDRSVLRGLCGAGGHIADLGFRSDGRTSDELIDAADQILSRLRNHKTSTEGPRAFAHWSGIADQRIEAASQKGASFSGLATGFTDLDVKLDGLHGGDLVVVGARPSMGKTALALGLAEHVAIYEKKAVAVFSLEMPGDQIAMRMKASFCRVPLEDLRRGTLGDREWDRLSAQGGLLNEAQIFIDDTSALTPVSLRARARKLKRDHNIGLVVVDYIQLMGGDGEQDGRTNEVSGISRELKRLAKELDVPIVVLSQLNRSVEKRPNKRPVMSDLRESGGIEQDADVIAFIYRDEVYNDETKSPGVAEIIIAKQRNGPLDTVKLTYLGKYTRFENMAQDYAQASFPAPQPRAPRSEPRPAPMCPDN